AVPCRRGAGNGCRGTPAPPPVPHEALLLPTAPHSTPLFPTVNIENTSHLAKWRAKSQVRGGGAEWGPPRPRPRAPVRARGAPGHRAARHGGRGAPAAASGAAVGESGGPRVRGTRSPWSTMVSRSTWTSRRASRRRTVGWAGAKGDAPGPGGTGPSGPGRARRGIGVDRAAGRLRRVCGSRHARRVVHGDRPSGIPPGLPQRSGPRGAGSGARRPRRGREQDQGRGRVGDRGQAVGGAARADGAAGRGAP